MTIARSRQVNLETTPYYHVIGRCYSQGRRIFQTGKIWAYPTSQRTICRRQIHAGG